MIRADNGDRLGRLRTAPMLADRAEAGELLEHALAEVPQRIDVLGQRRADGQAAAAARRTSPTPRRSSPP